MATAIFSAGTAIGAIIAVPIVAFSTSSLGWRASFLVTGLVGFVWLCSLAVAVRNARTSRASRPRNGATLLRVGRESRRRRGRPSPSCDTGSRRGLLLGRFMVDPVWQFYLFWLPSYLVEARLSLRTVGAIGWLPFSRPISGVWPAAGLGVACWNAPAT